MLNPSYMTLQVPNSVTFPGGSFLSTPLLTVNKVTTHVTLGVNDIASGIPGVVQAQSNVGMLRFNLTTDIALAPWRSIRLERGGGSQNPELLWHAAVIYAAVNDLPLAVEARQDSVYIIKVPR